MALYWRVFFFLWILLGSIYLFFSIDVDWMLLTKSRASLLLPLEFLPSTALTLLPSRSWAGVGLFLLLLATWTGTATSIGISITGTETITSLLATADFFLLSLFRDLWCKVGTEANIGWRCSTTVKAGGFEGFSKALGHLVPASGKSGAVLGKWSQSSANSQWSPSLFKTDTPSTVTDAAKANSKTSRAMLTLIWILFTR